ncbi:hypothetical protein U1Q18_029208 [Sarracenia purpurea var. burkii]
MAATNDAANENPSALEKNKPGLFEKKKMTRVVSEKYEKTKAAASTGMKKVKEGVKEGASASANWMKLKYHALKDKQRK